MWYHLLVECSYQLRRTPQQATTIVVRRQRSFHEMQIKFREYKWIMRALHPPAHQERMTFRSKLMMYVLFQFLAWNETMQCNC